MKRYRVEFSHSAESELTESIRWGVANWGEEATIRWARKFRRKITTLLKAAPLAHSIAPEYDLSPVEIRQIVVGRYRALFEIRGRTVNILHIRGPFTERK